MDRQKTIHGKKGKGRAQAVPAGDLIALGGKTGGPAESKRPSSPQPTGRSKLMTATGSKREASVFGLGTSSSSLSALKPKPKAMSQGFSGLGRGGLDQGGRSPAPHYTATPQLMAFEEAAIDVAPSELLSKVLAAAKEGDEERMEGLVCGAVKHLRNNRSKPDPTAYLTLMYLAKTQSSIFLSDLATEAFCSVLKRDVALNFKAKGNALVSVFACNVLMAAFSEETSWPDNFVKVYIDDLMGERVWVDRDDCKSFVENILTAFPTRASPKHLLSSNDLSLSITPGGASPQQNLFEDDESSKSLDGGDSSSSVLGLGGADIGVFPRYPYQQQNIEEYVLELVRDYINKRQPMDPSFRNLIRLMTVTAGYGEVRQIAAQRLESWLQNPKLQKTAQDLLLAVCVNCSLECTFDQEVIHHLVKMRTKFKPQIQHHTNCIREMLKQNSNTVRLLVKHCITNEFTNTRNPNNLPMVQVAFSQAREEASRTLAEVMQEMLANPENNYIRLTRGLLREVVKYVKHDMDFVIFCRTLLEERRDGKVTDLEPALRERFVLNACDLHSATVLLMASLMPLPIREGEQLKDLETWTKFYNNVSVIMRDAVFWVHDTVPKIVQFPGVEYTHVLKRILFMDPVEHYCKDNWPLETEKIYLHSLVSDVPVLEDTVMKLMVMGLSDFTRQYRLQSEFMDIVETLVTGAAKLHSRSGFPVLQIESTNLFTLVFNVAKYHVPENTQLPQGYSAPDLAISTAYWKGWIVLLILGAFNPTTIGKTGWDTYPTLRYIMEMMMINKIAFPPPSSATDDKMVQDIVAAENMKAQQEENSTLEFESILANKTITKETSLLVKNTISLDPNGTARCPPLSIMTTLMDLNREVKIGQILSDCRDPDFLDEVIRRQDDSKLLPWLAEMTQTDDRPVEKLPVACVCEFLLHDPRDTYASDHGEEDDMLRMKMLRYKDILRHLQQLIHSTSDNSGRMAAVFYYLIRRLHSSHANARKQALRGLSVLLADHDDNEMETDSESESRMHDWLLVKLPSMHLFGAMKNEACKELAKTFVVESDHELLNSYIIFISRYAMDLDQQTLDLVVLDISQLIVERGSVLNHILPDVTTARRQDYERSITAFIHIFYSYLSKTRTKDKDYTWSNNQDQIMLQWSSGECAIMYILSVHAMVIILSFGPPKDQEAAEMYSKLLDIWFPRNEPMPTAFLLDTSEEALLLPDWLKLRMIRSTEEHLVNSALSELDTRQLLLFVQSFGIPVDSMTYLLSHLDQAAEDNPQGLMELVDHMMTDATYINNLLEVQRKRGVQTGDRFFKLVQEHHQAPAATAVEMMEMDVKEECWAAPQTVRGEYSSSASALSKDFFKLFSPEVQAVDQNKLFQHIVKVIAGDKGKALSLASSVTKRLESNQGRELALQMLNNPGRSCPLVRVFIANWESQPTAFVPALKIILEVAGPDCKSSLVPLVSQYIQTHTKHKPISRKRQASIDMESLKSHGKVRPQSFVEGVKGIRDNNRLEPLVKEFMQESLQHQSSKDGIAVACSLLQQSTVQSSANTAQQSLLTDWLELMDPEIISAETDAQEQLVFGASSVPLATRSGERKKGGNPYLLSLLTHQSQWGTLQRCLVRILSLSKLTRLNPTSVLDFVWACRHKPKIWQGREVKTEESDMAEDLFALTSEQLVAVVEFIVLESCQSHDQPLTNDRRPSTCQNATRAENKEEDEDEGGVGGRFQLLLWCISDRDHRLSTIVTHIEQKLLSSASGVREQCYLKLLQELYMHFPYILAWLPTQGPFVSDWMVSEQTRSSLDTVAERLISVLGKAGAGAISKKRMDSANLVCRKLATRHPKLILRQLPLLAAALGGRAQLTIGEMKHRNLLILFTHVLGLMELLQPDLFDRRHTALPAVLQPYFSLFRMHGKETLLLGSLVSKLVIILQNFVTFDPPRASSMLQQYLQLLSDLMLVYPNMAELKSLVTGLTLPRQNQSETVEEGQEEDSAPQVNGTIRPQTSGLTFAQIQPFVKRMSNSSSATDLLQVLKDLDETSQRRVSVLEHFENELQRLMTHVNDACRSLVFDLIKRHIIYCPRKAHDFLPSYLTCLQSNRPEVVNSALRYLPEFTIFCNGEEASILLQRALEASLKGSVDSASSIREALAQLSMLKVMEGM